MKAPSLYLVTSTTGFQALHDDGLNFDPSAPFAGCRICGLLFQTALDRLAVKTQRQQLDAEAHRTMWQHQHSRTHPDHEHRLLAISGLWCTPEAAMQLAAFGVYALSDIAISDEHAQAGREAKAIPSNDCHSN